jgi:branched-chain amino acid aminotransferase
MSMGLKVYIDGKFFDRSEAKISVFDHGLLYGDGVFEGIRAYEGRVFRLREHLKRLYESAKMIMLKIPLKIEELEQAVLQTLRENNLHDAYIRLVVTRGEGDLGLDPRLCPHPSIIIITDKITLYPDELYQKGIKIVAVSTRRNIPEAVNPCAKSLNYLNNILAKIEAVGSNAHDALMLSAEGYVVECSGTNIFILRNEMLLTPPASLGALEGITRNAIISLARKSGIEVQEESFTRYQLYNSEECFLTGTAAEVMPVVEVDKRVIADGKPGEITRKLSKEFKNLTRKEGIPIY